MAFATVEQFRSVFGDKRIVIGTFTNGAGDSGGEVITGLTKVEAFFIQSTGTAVIATAPVVNETLPLESGSVTIVTALNEDGSYMAIGLE